MVEIDADAKAGHALEPFNEIQVSAGCAMTRPEDAAVIARMLLLNEMPDPARAEERDNGRRFAGWDGPAGNPFDEDMLGVLACVARE